MYATENVHMFFWKSFSLQQSMKRPAALGTVLACAGLFLYAQGPAIQPLQSGSLPPSLLVQPADLARELALPNPSSRPTIVYAGFRTLFAGGHIPGATFHGSASTTQGLADIRRWAASLPRSTNLVIYCGCCPFERCPNIRPAFALFRDMGFTRLRVLELSTSFAADWADKNYPVEKGLR